jgi:hypothetical protein
MTLNYRQEDGRITGKLGGDPTDYRQECTSKNGSQCAQGSTSNGYRASPIREHVLEPTKYLLPLAIKTSFTEWHEKAL